MLSLALEIFLTARVIELLLLCFSSSLNLWKTSASEHSITQQHIEFCMNSRNLFSSISCYFCNLWNTPPAISPQNPKVSSFKSKINRIDLISLFIAKEKILFFDSD